MFNTQEKVPGFDQKDFKDAIKEYAKDYDGLVRHKEVGSQDTTSTDKSGASSTGKSLLGLTDEQYRQYMEDHGD